jgi:hypothetical protein
MKAKHSVWKTKLVKSITLFTAIFVAALFFGNAAGAGIAQNGTATMKTNVVDLNKDIKNQSPLRLAKGMDTPATPLDKNERLSTGSDQSVPLNPLEEIITYHVGPAVDAIGLTAGGTYQAAMRITPTEQAGYDAFGIIAVNWYHYEAGTHSGNIKIYAAGTPTSPGAEIASVPYTVTGAGMKRIDLTSSVDLPITEDIWVSVQITHAAGEYPIGIDAGPVAAGKGDWIEYGSGWQELSGAGYPYNWVIETVVDLTTQFEHDVGVVEVVEPATGVGSAFTPDVKVKNFGLNDETNVPVNLKITRYDYTTLLDEDFTGTFPPAGWTITNTKWEQSTTTYAGGVSPEAWFYWSPSETGTFRMYTDAIDTTGYTDLNLQFRSYVSHFATPYTLAVETSTDATNWQTVWSIDPTASIPAHIETIPINASQGVGSDTLYISWTFIGYSYNINEWAIDDCKIQLVDLVVEYNETVYIDINSGVQQDVTTFPDWLPADLGVSEDVSKDYKVEAETQLVGDNNTGNDYKSSMITLHFGWFHDVAVTGISSPESGTAQTFTPTVTVANIGQNDETSVPVQLVISKPLMSVHFNTWLPTGWTQEATGEWTQSSTANAGGTSPEARLYYSTIVGNYAYLQTSAIDTTGLTTLLLNFRSYIDNQYGGTYCKVLSRSDALDTWTDITPWSNPIDADIPAEKYTVDISGDIGNATQIRFEFSGTSAGLYYWYLDDVVIVQNDFTEYDQTVYVDLTSGEVMDVTFTPDWTPSDLGIAENTTIEYLTLADCTVPDDGDTTNNVFSKTVSLHYPYFDDVAVTQIIDPTDGLAQVQPVTVALANNGQNAESVDVNVLIEKFNGTVESFESSDGGYVRSGTPATVWAWGTPTAGPGSAHSGSKLWATNLAGTYPASSNAMLDKEITLPNGTVVMLTYFQWYQMETSYDGGNLKISTDGGATFSLLTPVGGYTGTANTANPLYPEPIYTGTATGNYWDKITVDLSAYAGQDVILRWHFGSDGSVQYAGWYIDDVAIGGPDDWLFEYSDTTSVSIGVGETMDVSLADWTPSDITLGFSIGYRATATADLIGYSDYVDEYFNNYVPGYYLLPTGWTVLQSGNKTWTPLSSGYVQCYEAVNSQQGEWLISPSMSTIGMPTVKLQYYVYFYKYSLGNTYVEVLGSADGGATWPTLIKTYTASAYGVNEVFDISSWAANQPNVKIAFVFYSDNDAYSSSYMNMDNFFVGSDVATSAESFDGTWGPYGDNPPTGWTITTNETAPVTWDNNNWHRYLNTGTDYCARIYYSPVRYQDDSLISNAIDCTALSQVTLKFDLKYSHYSSISFAYVKGSIDGGATWPYTIASYTTSYSSWTTMTYDISSWAAGQSNVKIRFQYIDHDGLYMYVNNFFIGTVTTVYSQDFNVLPYVPASWGPLGWQLNPSTDTHWSVSNTANAGGVAPEARFYYSPSVTSDISLYTGPIDTSAFSAMLLSFKEKISGVYGPYDLQVDTSTDNITWTTVYSFSPTSSVNARTTNVPLTVGVGSSTFQFRFTFSGYTYNIDYWYIDDVHLMGQTVIADGHPSDNTLMKEFTLSYEHDVGVSLITQPLGPFVSEELTWSGGATNNAISDGGYWFETAIRFNASDLAGVVDYDLNEVQFFKGYGTTNVPAVSGVVNIYSSTDPVAPETLITSQPYSVGEGSFWVNVFLADPVKIDPDLDYWIGVTYDAGYTSYPAGCDAGPAVDGKGDWLQDEVTPWTEMQVWGLDYNWNIKGVFVQLQEADTWPPGTYPIAALVDNYGVTFTETDFDVNAKVYKTSTAMDDVLVYEENVTVTTPLAPGTQILTTFPDITFDDVPEAEGNYRLEIKTMLANDDHTNNDKMTKTWTIQRPDVTPPTTTATVSGTMGDNDWYISDVTVTLTATDGKWPLGVNHTYYKIDDGDWNEYEVPFQVTEDGEHTVYFYSDDKAIPPNVEDEKEVSFGIDQTAPVITEFTATAQNALKTKWLLAVTATDATSGIALVEFYGDDALVGSVTTSPFEFLVEQKIHTAQCIVYDEAGNSKMSDVITAFEFNGQSVYLGQKLV